MNKLTIALLFILQVTCLESFGQVPGITYQAVILSPEGKGLPGVNHTNIPLATQEICLRFSFLNQDGEKEYEETIQTKTDPYGMVNVIIGKGEQVGGWVSSFDKIPWSMAAKFLEVSLDKSGSCSDFTAISKQEFTAVPFALFSVNSGATDSEVSQGKSAYQVWIDLGNVGSEQDFIKSLKGPAGVTGAAGPQGPTGAAGATGATGPAGNTGATGPAGTSGSNGLSAYQVWLQLGNTGTEANFIASLKGPTGAAGPQGPAGTTGATGPAGNTGATGPAGTSGSNGISAYQVWLQLGNTGTEANFIASLKGPTGAAGPQGPTGAAGADGAAASAATFVDLSMDQTVGGTKTFTNPIAGSITGSSGSTSGNAATATLATEATKLATPRAINGVAFDGSAPITVTAAAETLTGATLNATVTGSSLTSVGTLTDLTVTNPIAGSITGSSGSTSGNAATATLAAQATKLATPRTINGVAFDGSAPITVTAAAETLTGATLNATVTGSSLTSVGTLTDLTVTNPIAGSITGSSGSTSGNAATATLAAQATKLATPRTINGVAFDGSTNISITSSADAATLTGTTLASNVVSSSLTSTGTLNKLEVTTTSDKISLFNNNSSSNKDISLKSTKGNILIETVNSAGKIFLTSTLVGISGTNTAVGIGTQTPNSTSILELNSTTKGFLPPRMNDVQRDAISDPPSGLMIYCTNCGVNGGEPQYFNGNAWVNLTGGPAASAPTLRVGDDHLGGRIFYIYQSYDPGYIAGQVHGLIVAPVNLGIRAWGSSSAEDVSGTSSELNTGQANTTAIINFVGGSRNPSYAAESADSYTIINSYSDWYLPSKKEMIKLIQSSISTSGPGWQGLTYNGYWTSTQFNATNANSITSKGEVESLSKITSKDVRPIKSF